MDIKDLRIDTFRTHSTNVEMRVRHLKTGTSVEGIGLSPIQLRSQLIERLEKKLQGMAE